MKTILQFLSEATENSIFQSFSNSVGKRAFLPYQIFLLLSNSTLGERYLTGELNPEHQSCYDSYRDGVSDSTFIRSRDFAKLQPEVRKMLLASSYAISLIKLGDHAVKELFSIDPSSIPDTDSAYKSWLTLSYFQPAQKEALLLFLLIQNLDRSKAMTDLKSKIYTDGKQIYMIHCGTIFRVDYDTMSHDYHFTLLQFQSTVFPESHKELGLRIEKREGSEIDFYRTLYQENRYMPELLLLEIARHNNLLRTGAEALQNTLSLADLFKNSGVAASSEVFALLEQLVRYASQLQIFQLLQGEENREQFIEKCQSLAESCGRDIIPLIFMAQVISASASGAASAYVYKENSYPPSYKSTYFTSERSHQSLLNFVRAWNSHHDFGAVFDQYMHESAIGTLSGMEQNNIESLRVRDVISTTPPQLPLTIDSRVIARIAMLCRTNDSNRHETKRRIIIIQALDKVMRDFENKHKSEYDFIMHALGSKDSSFKIDYLPRFLLTLIQGGEVDKSYELPSIDQIIARLTPGLLAIARVMKQRESGAKVRSLENTVGSLQLLWPNSKAPLLYRWYISDTTWPEHKVALLQWLVELSASDQQVFINLIKSCYSTTFLNSGHEISYDKSLLEVLPELESETPQLMIAKLNSRLKSYTETCGASIQADEDLILTIPQLLTCMGLTGVTHVSGGSMYCPDQVNVEFEFANMAGAKKPSQYTIERLNQYIRLNENALPEFPQYQTKGTTLPMLMSVAESIKPFVTFVKANIQPNPLKKFFLSFHGKHCSLYLEIDGGAAALPDLLQQYLHRDPSLSATPKPNDRPINSGPGLFPQRSDAQDSDASGHLTENHRDQSRGGKCVIS